MIVKKLLFLFFTFSIYLLSAQSPGHVHFRAGESLLKQNKTEEALEKFNQALLEEPSNFSYHSSRGITLLKLNKLEMALSAFQKAVFYKEDYALGYKLMGDVYLNQGNVDKAINHYNIAYKTETEVSGKVIFKSELIQALLLKERYQSAEIHVNELLSFAPYNSEAHFLSGELYLATGDYTLAIKGYKKALEYNKEVRPDMVAKIYYGLGKALFQNGDTENAKKAWAKANYGVYKKMISEDMSRLNPDYYYKIGVSYYLSGDMDEAVENLKKAVEMKPEFSAAYKYLGIVSDKRDLSSEANTYFSKAVQTEKDSSRQADIYQIWLNSQIENENFAGAITSAEKIIKVYPYNAKVWLQKSQAEFHLGRFQPSIHSAEKGLEVLNSTDPVKKAPFYFMLGMSARHMGNVQKAKDAFQNALFGNTKYAAKHELDILNGAIVK